MSDLTTNIIIAGDSSGAQAAVVAVDDKVQKLSADTDAAAQNTAKLRAMLLSAGDSGAASVAAAVKVMAGLDKTTDDAAKSAGGLKKGIDDVGDSAATAKTKVDDAATSTAKLKDEVDKTGDSAKSLEDKFKSVSQSAFKLGAIGTAGLLLSNHLIAAADEAENLELKLQAVLRAQGRLQDLPVVNKGVQQVTVAASLPDDDPIKASAIAFARWSVATKEITPLLEAVQRQSETTGQSVESLANSFGKAIKNGDAEQLKRIIGVFSATEEAAISAGYAISEEAGQMALIGAIINTVKSNTGELGSTLTATQKAANDAGRSADDLATAMGKGAAAAKKEVDNFTTSLLNAAGANEDVAQSAGKVFYAGSMIATTVGGVTAFVFQVLAGAAALNQLGGTSAVWATITTWTSTATTAITTWASTTIASFRAALIAASTTAAGFNLITLGVTGIATAAALTIGWVAYAMGQHIGWIDKEQSYLDRLTAGWYRLSDAILGTQSVAGASLQQNETDFAAELEKVKAGNAKAVLGGTKTQPQADEDNRKAERDLHEKWAREDARIGDNANLIKHQDAMARLSTPSASSAAPVVAPPPVSASAPPATLTPIAPAGALSLPTGASNSGASSTLDLGNSLSGGSMGGGASVDDSQVIALKDAIKAEKNRYKKAALQNQLTLLQRQIKAQKEADREAEKAQKEAERAAEKAQKEALRNAGLEAGADAAESGAVLDERGAQLQADATLAGSRDKRQMNRETRDIRAQVKVGSLDKEAGGSRLNALRDAYAARDKARQADLEMQIAQIDANRALIEGAARAAGQEGNQAQSTLRIAQAKANRALMLGRAKSAELRDEADELKASAAENFNATQNNGARQSRELAAALAAGRLSASRDLTPNTDGAMFKPPSERRDVPSVSLNDTAPPLRVTTPIQRIEEARMETPLPIAPMGSSDPYMGVAHALAGIQKSQNARIEEAIAKGANYQNGELFVPDRVLNEGDDSALLTKLAGFNSEATANDYKLRDGQNYSDAWPFQDARPEAPQMVGSDEAARVDGLSRMLGAGQEYAGYTNQGRGFAEGTVRDSWRFSGVRPGVPPMTGVDPALMDYRGQSSFAPTIERGDNQSHGFDGSRKVPQLRAAVVDVLRDILGNQVATVKVTFDDNDSNASGARLFQAG